MSTFADRRNQLLSQLPGGVAVFFAAPMLLRNNDVEHEYRQDSDFYYLTGFDEPESVLVLCSSHPEHRTILFVRPRDPERETWDGARAGLEGAVQQFGADVAFPIHELAQRLPEYLQNHTSLLYRLGRDRACDDRILSALDGARARGRQGKSWPVQILDPAPLLHEMRLFKQPGEIQSMRRAAEITRDGHLAAMRMAAPGKHEYEVEALLREVFRRNGSERQAYSPIVGAGANATVLHYRTNRMQLKRGDLLLIDAGCEYDYYASDVTRTFPVSGTFTRPQREIYEIVLRAQLEAIEATRPGATLDDIHRRGLEIIIDGLISLGLLAGSREQVLEDQSYRRFFMHRTSHFLGMDVHDVGSYFLNGAPRPLCAGMVLTIEPGIYIAPNSSGVPDDYLGIGVRIEDDLLVTGSGYTNLTHDIPKSVDEVERACAA